MTLRAILANIGPLPDGEIDDGDRRMVLFGPYLGAIAMPPATATRTFTVTKAGGDVYVAPTSRVSKVSKSITYI